MFSIVRYGLIMRITRKKSLHPSDLNLSYNLLRSMQWDQMFMKQINPKFVYPILLHHNRSHANCREWPIVSSQSFIKNVLSWKKSAIGRLPKQIPIFLNCKRCLSKIWEFLRGFKRFCGKQNWHCGIDRTMSYSAKVFT